MEEHNDIGFVGNEYEKYVPARNYVETSAMSASCPCNRRMYVVAR